jgi:hypothetical protein
MKLDYKASQVLFDLKVSRKSVSLKVVFLKFNEAWIWQQISVERELEAAL